MLTEQVIEMAECIMHLMEATIPTFKFVYERGYCLWGRFLSFFLLVDNGVVEILMSNLTI